MSGQGDDLIAAAKRVVMRRQEVLSNNLANASTVGFKGEHVFARLMEGAMGDDGPVAASMSDLRPGRLESTSRPLDLAIEGAGFFVVETAAGERYTRGGSFTLGEDGTLVDGQGNALLGKAGKIPVPAHTTMANIGVDAGGQVSIDGRLVGRLRVELAADGTILERESRGLFVPPATRLPDRAAQGVRQGALEASNVNIIDGLVDLVTNLRAFGLLEQADSVTEAVDSRAAELGKPAS